MRASAWLLALTALLFACGAEPEANDAEVGTFVEEEQAPLVPVPEATGPRDVVVIEVEDHGEIRIELLDELAPEAAATFARLVEADHYDGTTFHRVLPGYMIQGGDPNSRDRDPRNDGQGDRNTHVPDELGDVSQVEGVVSFASRGRPGSQDGQFFIMVGENRAIDGQYTVFGRVLEGLDVAVAISRVERDKYERWGPADRPLQNVVMRDLRIEPAAGGTAWRAEDEEEGTELADGEEWSS